MGDIFQEIDEEIRRDKAEALWKRFGSYVLGGAAALIAVTAGWVGWQEYNQRQSVSFTASIHAAMNLAQAQQNPQAIEAFTAATESADDNQAALVLLQEASIRAREGDAESARGLYQSVRENEAVGTPYRALAAIRSVELDLDTGDPGAMLDWLQPYAGSDSPWRLIVWELSAFLEQRNGNSDGAKAHLERIRDDDESSAAARARVEAYLAQR